MQLRFEVWLQSASRSWNIFKNPNKIIVNWMELKGDQDMILIYLVTYRNFDSIY